MKKSILFLLGAMTMAASCTTPLSVKGSSSTSIIKENSYFYFSLAEEDSLVPVRPGGVNGQKFWNRYAKQFIYVPSFDFPEEKKASSYRFQAQDRYGNIHVFTADSPKALLSPVWKQIPAGPVYLTVDALDRNGKKIREVGDRVFYRNAPFSNSYPPAVCSYAEAAKKAYEYLFNMKAVQSLATGRPDLSYDLFCYPSKMHSSIIRGMVNYAEMVPAKKKQALAIARGAADYLIRTAVPEGTVLEYLPQTYEGDKLAAKKFAGIIMMLYPASVGSSMLTLYKAVKEPEYLDHAVKIGEQYLKLQQKNGSWYLNLRISDGKPQEKNYCMPVTIMGFLEELSSVTKNDKYRLAAEKCLPHMEKMMKSFDWEGQFEDVEAQQTKYLNMTFHNATSLYLYLCRKSPVSRKRIAEAREIQRYSEDQFVVWEQPGWAGSGNVYDWRTEKELHEKKWDFFRGCHVPCVLEQYRCYVPVDGASAKMITYYLMMYRLEKNPLDLAKAKALGDSLTRLQQKSGRIPTWGHYDSPASEDWINCMYGTANALKLLSESVKN